MFPNLEHEQNAGFPDRLVIGVDEVGRGCLAGPVMAGAYVLPLALAQGERPEWLKHVRDSKLVSAKKRLELESSLKQWASAWAVAEASVQEIDQINILNAVELAMLRAVQAVLLKLQTEHKMAASSAFVLVDGNRVPKTLGPLFPSRIRAVVKGDQQSLSMACASILAKVERDRRMEALEQKFSGYGLAVHKGYGTAAHLKALKELGVTPVHRLSFGPVRELASGLNRA